MQHSFNETLVHLPARRCSLCRWEHSKLIWVRTKDNLFEKGWAKCKFLQVPTFPPDLPRHMVATNQVTPGRMKSASQIFAYGYSCYVTRQQNTLGGNRYLPSSAYTSPQMPLIGWCNCDQTVMNRWESMPSLSPIQHDQFCSFGSQPRMIVMSSGVPNLPTKGQMHFFALELFYAEILLQLACFPDSFPWNYTSSTSIHTKALHCWPAHVSVTLNWICCWIPVACSWDFSNRRQEVVLLISDSGFYGRVLYYLHYYDNTIRIVFLFFFLWGFPQKLRRRKLWPRFSTSRHQQKCVAYRIFHRALCKPSKQLLILFLFGSHLCQNNKASSTTPTTHKELRRSSTPQTVWSGLRQAPPGEKAKNGDD